MTKISVHKMSERTPRTLVGVMGMGFLRVPWVLSDSLSGTTFAYFCFLDMICKHCLESREDLSNCSQPAYNAETFREYKAGEGAQHLGG